MIVHDLYGVDRLQKAATTVAIDSLASKPIPEKNRRYPIPFPILDLLHSEISEFL